jgi:hypothetical protein
VALPPTAAHAGSKWIVGISANRTHVVVGKAVTFTGTVRPAAAAAGRKVVLQERYKPSAAWRVQRSATVNGQGHYVLRDKPSVNTVHVYRVVMPATKQHARGVSASTRVTAYSWQELTDRKGVNGMWIRFGTAYIDGNSYKNSVIARYAADPGEAYGTAHIEYNLDHKCIKLSATFGLSDDSETGGQAEVNVLSDGTMVYSNTFDLGEKEAKTIALDKPLKLRLDTHQTSPTASGYGVFGSVRILCTR